MPQAEHLGVPETQVAGDTASTASADELSREVLHQNNLSEDSRNIYFLKDAPVMRA
ncbi:MATE family efflux transporter, partial [Rothia dentocariosa]